MMSPLIEINQLPSREAMNLPNHFVPGRIFGYEKLVNEFSSYKSAELENILTTAPELRARFAAGCVLALRGDSRLSEPTMIEIPGGVISIGLEPEEVDVLWKRYAHLGVKREWIQKEAPRHQVELRTFRISKFPVTNCEYLQFLIETHWPELPTSWEFGQYPVLRANHPVYTVTPAAAEAYCKWLSAKTGRTFRLPTEAEWEYAAAGPEGREFPWGDTFEKDHCNTLETGLLTTTPVGMFPESDSPFGVSDMAGNVEEFVKDNYRAYPGGEIVTDDLLQKFGNYRIARGGSFTRHCDLARCKRRHGHYDKDIYVMGFRIAEEV